MRKFDGTTTYTTQDDVELRKEWFAHVLQSIEKISDKCIELTDKIYTDKLSLTRDIAVVKESVHIELKCLRQEFNRYKDKCSNNRNSSQIRLDTKIDKFLTKIDLEKEKIDDKINAIFVTKIDKLSNKIDKINELMITIRIKMAVIGIFSGIFGSLLLFIVQMLIRKYVL